MGIGTALPRATNAGRAAASHLRKRLNSMASTAYVDVLVRLPLHGAVWARNAKLTIREDRWHADGAGVS